MLVILKALCVFRFGDFSKGRRQDLEHSGRVGFGPFWAGPAAPQPKPESQNLARPCPCIWVPLPKPEPEPGAHSAKFGGA